MPMRISREKEMESAPCGSRVYGQCDKEPLPIYLPKFQKVNPLRLPSWRWDRACNLAVVGQEYSPATDDAETGRGLQYLQALKSCCTEEQRQKLAARMPEIHKAHEIHEQGGPLRWVLEAALLTGQTSPDVGQRLGLPAVVVDWYEKLFYCVREDLEARDWITFWAIGKKVFRGCTKQDVDILLKWFAYFGGPLILEICLPPLLPEQAGTLFDPEQVDPEMSQCVCRVVDALCVPAGEELHPELEAMLKETAEQAEASQDIKTLGEKLPGGLPDFQEDQTREPEKDSTWGASDPSHLGWLPESGEGLRERA